MDEFTGHGHNVFVVSSIEKRFETSTYLSKSNDINVLRVQTGNIISNTNYITKGFAILQLQSKFINAIKNFYNNLSFDLIIYTTPPVQYNRIIKYLKNKSGTKSYLLLKDITPQDAIDLQLLSKWNPVYWSFRKKEKETYQLADYIGCMSPANVNYLLKHNTRLSAEKVEVCANSLKDRGVQSEQERIAIRWKIRKDFSIGENDFLMVYGGNLGISQGLNFLLEILSVYRNSKNTKFLIVGEGTWYRRIAEYISQEISNNVILHERVSPDNFKEFLVASDIGLIFLDPRHTIPNFPSRLTSYLEACLPVIACTDTATDIGDIIQNEGCGYKVLSGDIHRFQSVVSNLIDSTEILKEKSANARRLFEKEYTTAKAYDVIMKHFQL